jgi:hypothetical protein
MKEIFYVSYVLLWAVVAIQGFAFLEILRQQAALRRRVGPDQGASLMPGSVETGAPLPELQGIDPLTGEPTAWGRYLRHEVGVAAFVTPRCPKCHEVAEGLAELWPNIRHEVDVIAIVQGNETMSASSSMRPVFQVPSLSWMKKEQTPIVSVSP